MKKMMVMIFIIICMCSVPFTGLACTAFMLDNSGQPVCGKNADAGHIPGFVIVNKRGVAKTSAFLPQEPDAEHISWTSRFGSVTFNCLAREWPHDGINEAGLFMSTLSTTILQQTAYPKPDSRIPFGQYPLVQYMLDNFSTVDEVIASFQSIRIPKPAMNASMPLAYHLFVADSRGNCVTIDFVSGKTVCHAGQTMPVKVLANSPYDLSIAVLGLFQGFGGFFPIPHPMSDRGSLIRFAIAADMVKKYNPEVSIPAVDYSFQILQDVEINPSDHTALWSIVYDSSHKQILFRSWSKDQIRRVDLSAVDFSCTTPVKVLDISAELSGDVSNSFVDYTKEIDLEMLNSWGLPQQAIDDISSYPDTTVCTE